jgi:hypothetical protein
MTKEAAMARAGTTVSFLYCSYNAVPHKSANWVPPSLTWLALCFDANEGAIWRRAYGNSLLNEPVK